MKFVKIFGIVSSLVVASSWSMPTEAKSAKQPDKTVTQRQVELMKDIDASEKSGELTFKEAAALRKSGVKVTEKEARMKDKNGGKLSYKNITEIEGDLNKISNKNHKQQLQKRVQN